MAEATKTETLEFSEIQEFGRRLPAELQLVERALLDRLIAFEHNQMELLHRLFGEDEVAWGRTVSLMTTAAGMDAATIEIGVAIDQAIRERDAARRAAARFEDAGKPFLAHVVRGEA